MNDHRCYLCGVELMDGVSSLEHIIPSALASHPWKPLASCAAVSGKPLGSRELAECFARLESGLCDVAVEVVRTIFAAELARLEAELAMTTPDATPQVGQRDVCGEVTSVGRSTKNGRSAVRGRMAARGQQRGAAKQPPTSSAAAFDTAPPARAPRSRRNAGTSLANAGAGSAAVSVSVASPADLGALAAAAPAPDVASGSSVAPPAVTQDAMPPTTSMASSVASRTRPPAIAARATAVDLSPPDPFIGDDRDAAAAKANNGIAETGTVKWFSPEKAYGFIAGDKGGDVFVHLTAVAAGGLRTLEPGQRVRYESRQGPKGRFAATVTATRSIDREVEP